MLDASSSLTTREKIENRKIHGLTLANPTSTREGGGPHFRPRSNHAFSSNFPVHFYLFIIFSRVVSEDVAPNANTQTMSGSRMLPSLLNTQTVPSGSQWSILSWPGGWHVSRTEKLAFQHHVQKNSHCSSAKIPYAQACFVTICRLNGGPPHFKSRSFKDLLIRPAWTQKCWPSSFCYSQSLCLVSLLSPFH